MNWKDFLAASIKKCIFVLGPTGSGKSSWALLQAEKHGGSIVNIDSVQFYEGLIVGAAAPTASEKSRVPHYLYSYVKPPKEMTAGGYLKDFYALLESPVRFPLFIVGGTGFYIQALERGMYDVEKVPPEFRKKIEDELEQLGAEVLHQELLAKDPASRIHVNDHFRLVRALEIIRFTGKIPSELQAQPQNNKYEFPFPLLKVGFDFSKPEFEKRISLRTRNMIENGIIDEVQSARKAGLMEWAPLKSVGYRETVQYLAEGQSLDWLQDAIFKSTMQLIKKQKTWFKRDRSVLWSNQTEQLDQFLT